MNKRNAPVLLTMFVLCSLTGCAEFKPTTSYFGHGKYHCFYRNTSNGQSFDAKNGEQEKAMHEAKMQCLKNGSQCQFEDCLFK